MEQEDYRDRIYRHYSSARHEQLAPTQLSDLQARAPYLRRLISRHFPARRDAAILDLGCGHGAIVHFARQSGYTNVIGVDVSPEQVAEARRLGIEGVLEGDVMQTLRDLPAASQDVIIAFDLIEHFRRNELIALVDAVARALAPSGTWIIHTPNAESPFFGRIRYGDFTHEEAYTRTSIGQLLLSSGFREVSCFEDAPVVHGLKSAVRFALWKGIRAGLRTYLAAETGITDGNAIFSQNFLTIAKR